MSFGVGGSLFDDPIGFMKPVSAGGGGLSKVGSAVFKYTSISDPKGPEWTQTVDAARIRFITAANFTQAVDTPLITLRAQNSFTQSVDTTLIRLRAANDFTQDVSRVQIAASPKLATKDSYVDVLAGCVGGNTNHDGEDLECEGIATSRKDVMIGWDLSGFDANATVLSATVYLEQKTSPGVTGTNTLNTISAANESWAEGTVVCNNIPASVASAGTFSNSGTGEKTVSLNATGLAALEARMGVGSFSLRMTTGGLVTNHAFEAADEGTNDAAGPRLEITFTVPT